MKFCQKWIYRLSKLSFFNTLESDARYQIYFGIRKHSKVFRIKDFIEFGAGTTEQFFIEFCNFQPHILVLFWLSRNFFLAKIIILGLYFHEILSLDAKNDPTCQKLSSNNPYLTQFMTPLRSENQWLWFCYSMFYCGGVTGCKSGFLYYWDTSQKTV